MDDAGAMEGATAIWLEPCDPRSTADADAAVRFESAYEAEEFHGGASGWA